jgi:hypothetical protein
MTVAAFLNDIVAFMEPRGFLQRKSFYEFNPETQETIGCCMMGAFSAVLVRRPVPNAISKATLAFLEEQLHCNNLIAWNDAAPGKQHVLDALRNLSAEAERKGL